MDGGASVTAAPAPLAVNGHGAVLHSTVTFGFVDAQRRAESIVRGNRLLLENI